MNTENNQMASLSTFPESCYPETLDFKFLSESWCNFALQALQPPLPEDVSSLAKMLKGDTLSWINMQQAMHPELHYNAGFQTKWWKRPFGNMSIKKWAKDKKEKRKEDKRLQTAQVHAAVSIAGLATTLAAIAKNPDLENEPSKTTALAIIPEENPKRKLDRVEQEPREAWKAAMASAAAIVASHCAQVALSMGATGCQLSNAINSALSGTGTSDILTLTAAAATSLRGEATLKARAGCRRRALKSSAVFPIEMVDNNPKDDFDFERCKSVLSKGATLTIFTADGKTMVRLVSLHLNNDSKVILRIIKRNLLNVVTSKKECQVLDQHAELPKDSGANKYDKCYQILLMTTRGIMKLDMAGNHRRYMMWVTTINQMLKLSP